MLARLQTCGLYFNARFSTVQQLPRQTCQRVASLQDGDGNVPGILEWSLNVEFDQAKIRTYWDLTMKNGMWLVYDQWTPMN